MLAALAKHLGARPASASASPQTALAGMVAAHSESGWVVSREEVANNTTVVEVSNFLPAGTAMHWHAMLNGTWRRSEECRSGGTCAPGADGNGCSWLYTTNSRGGNQKIRSVFRQEVRRAEVNALNKRGAFAYSKWELSTAHPLFRALGDLMKAPAVRRAIARLLWPKAPSGHEVEMLGAISDYFVTAFDDGDFLSTHSDGASGSLAWVLHLAGHHGGWSSTAGGALRFNAGSAVRTHRDFEPSFNRLLLFLTRPDHCPHQVLPVTHTQKGAEPRFGITGWYMTASDRFDAATRAQNELMRAAASKTSTSGQCL